MRIRKEMKDGLAKKSLCKYIVFASCVSLLLAGCAKEDGSTDSNAVSSSEDETEEETLEPIIPTMVSMEDIREAAENFSGSYKNLDFTDTVFSIPENDAVYELTFTMPTEAEEFDRLSEF